ncbi:barstar family protein [Guggenheimella bovis]
MKTIRLHTEGFKDKLSTHEILQEAFDFPSYYGKNLDALWDMLTTISEPTSIVLTIDQDLTEYSEETVLTLVESALENDALTLTKVDQRTKTIHVKRGFDEASLRFVPLGADRIFVEELSYSDASLIDELLSPLDEFGSYFITEETWDDEFIHRARINPIENRFRMYEREIK